MHDTTYIGLVDFVEKNPDKKELSHFITTVIDHIFQTEYVAVVDRPITPVTVYAGHKSKASLGVRGVWDTGSRTSCISERLVKKLDLQCANTMYCITANGPLERPCYYVDIQISDEILFENLLVIGYPLENHDCDVLIGMDIISKGKLTIDSTDGKTKISFVT